MSNYEKIVSKDKSNKVLYMALQYLLQCQYVLLNHYMRKSENCPRTLIVPDNRINSIIEEINKTLSSEHVDYKELVYKTIYTYDTKYTEKELNSFPVEIINILIDASIEYIYNKGKSINNNFDLIQKETIKTTLKNGYLLSIQSQL